ncbi:MAG: hypothetical protein ACLFUM_11990 [Spirochaetaceae bacterium]
MITIDRRYRENGPAPLYHQYDGQTAPQPAYLELTEEGEVTVDYDAENGIVPARVFEGRDIRWAIPNTLSVAGIDALLDELEPLLRQLHGSTGHRAFELEMSVEAITDKYAETTEPPEHEQIADAVEWVNPAWSETVDEYMLAEDKAAYLMGLSLSAEKDGLVLVNVDRLRDALDREVTERAEAEA